METLQIKKKEKILKECNFLWDVCGVLYFLQFHLPVKQIDCALSIARNPTT